MLGTNDACIQQEWDNRKSLIRQSLEELIEIYQSLQSCPLIMIATFPVRLDDQDLNMCIQNHIVPMQIEIVERYNLPIIPIHDLKKGFNETDYMDGLIPMILATRELLKKLNMLLRMC